MNVLVTGATGYVGSIVTAHLSKSHKVSGVGAGTAAGGGNSIHCCDLSDADAVSQLAEELHPDLVVHAAGNKNINYCENNPEAAFRINCDAVRNVAQFFGRRSRMVYVSTDYVFDGMSGGYTEEDMPAPRTVYGKSKLCGEEQGRSIAGDNFITLRMSALFDLHATFPRFLNESLSRKEVVECFSDVIYSPTYYRDFLAALDRIMARPTLEAKTFHVCGPAISRYGFACAFAEAFGFDLSLVRKSSAVGKGNYLFPDLSLNNCRSQEILQIPMTGVEDALQQLLGEVAL